MNTWNTLAREVIDDSLGTPPGNPSTGDCYVVALGAVGAWAGLDGALVVWDGSAWHVIKNPMTPGTAFLVSPIPGGSFIGHGNNLAIVRTPWPEHTYFFVFPISGQTASSDLYVTPVLLFFTGLGWSSGASGGGDHAALDHLDYASSGHTGFSPSAHVHAGGDITSGTVSGDRLPAMSETLYGAVPPTGTPSGKFLKDDGSFAAVSGTGTASETVTSGTTFGVAQFAGVSVEYSKGDHSHGTPTDPVPTHALLTSSVHGFDINGKVPSAAAADVVPWGGVSNPPATYAPMSHDNSAHTTSYAASSDLSTHVGLSTTAHGGIVADGDARLSDARTPLSHDNTKHSTAYAASSDLTTHEGKTATVHNFDASGNAPAQSHDNQRHSTAFEASANKGAASGYCGLDGSKKVEISNIPTGTTLNDVCIGNDSRLSDARTPLAHDQGATTITTGTLDGDRLGAPTTTKRGGVKATGTPTGLFLRDDDTWAAAGGGSNPPWYGVLYSNQNDCDPREMIREWNMLAVAGPTPTGITASLARCIMFTPPANITVNSIRLFGVGATASLYKFAIYAVGTGSAKLWDSGTVTSAANAWLNIATGLPISLVAGTRYWFCVTAVNVGTTAGFRSMPAPLGTNFWGADAAPIGNRALSLPVCAQFAVSTGVFPATLPAIAAAAYAGGTTGSVPFALLDAIA